MEKKPFKSHHFQGEVAPDIFEKMASNRGFWVCGIDEAGRGPSAGPIVAAAAIVRLEEGKRSLLRDSKVMTPRERMEAFHWVIKNSWYGIGIVNSRFIDEIGIAKSNIMAMNRAFAQLQASSLVVPSLILVDAVRLELPPIPIYPGCIENIDAEGDIFDNPWHKIISFPHSEQYSYSIAAASIIAKVTRDAIMDSLAITFPCYKLEAHKGYHTAKHRELLDRYGPAIIHRKSFLKNKSTKKNDDQIVKIDFEIL